MKVSGVMFCRNAVKYEWKKTVSATVLTVQRANPRPSAMASHSSASR